MTDQRKIDTGGGDYREIDNSGQYAEGDIHNDRHQQGVIADGQATVNIGEVNQHFYEVYQPSNWPKDERSSYTSRPMFNEIQSIEQNIANLREQLAGLRGTLSTAPEEDEVRLEQKIRKLRKKIANFEGEYWTLVSQNLPGWPIEAADADVVQREIVEQVNQFEALPPSELQTEMLSLLQSIRDRLDAPGTTAAAKLKGVISSIPPFVGLAYEAELDTEQFFKTYFPTFRGWVAALVKRNAKK
jgi:hypothetical protein